MNNPIKEYLEEISHYLGEKKDSEEILQEIEAHIHDKLQAEGIEPDEKNIARVLREYGKPREVAERYLEDSHIIRPSYRRFLFQYTWIIFFIHYGLKVISYISGISFSILPFDFSININSWSQLITHIPMTWIYDFGLVALVLYFITQEPGDKRLLWPNLGKFFSHTKIKKRKIWIGWFLLFIFIILFAVFLRQGSIVFYNPAELIKPDPMQRPDIYRVLSIIVLFILAVETITIFLQSRFSSIWITLGNNLLYLTAGLLLINMPADMIFTDSSLHGILNPMSWLLGIILLFIVYDIICNIKAILAKKAE